MPTSFGFGSQILLEIVTDILRDFYAHIGYMITDIYAYCVEINQMQQVDKVATYASLLGASLSAFVVIKSIIGTYGIGTEGDPDQDPIEIVYRLCKALGFMGANAWLFNELLKFSTAVGKDITKIVAGADTLPPADGMLDAAASSFFTAACTGVLTAGLIIFSITAAIRGAELTLNKIFLPFFALDIINSNPEKWRMFIFQYGIGFFSYVVQMFCFNVYIILYTRLEFGSFKNFVVLFGWLVLSIRSPKMLEKYIYATGTGQAISQGASRLGQVIMFTMPKG